MWKMIWKWILNRFSRKMNRTRWRWEKLSLWKRLNRLPRWSRILWKVLISVTICTALITENTRSQWEVRFKRHLKEKTILRSNRSYRQICNIHNLIITLIQQTSSRPSQSTLSMQENVLEKICSFGLKPGCFNRMLSLIFMISLFKTKTKINKL